MDYKFPHELFPEYFNSGPPNSEFRHNVGGWGVYGKVFQAGASSQHKDVPSRSEDWTFLPQHQVKGESWLPVEPLILPLLEPHKACKLLPTAYSDPMDFTDHMTNFYLHCNQEAFGTMSQVLGEQLPRKNRTFHLPCLNTLMDRLNHKKCEYTHRLTRVNRYHHLLEDVIYDIPPELLASHFNEEVNHRLEEEQFSEKATGGALGYIPLTESSTNQEGYLLYPGKAGHLSLNCHRVELKCHAGRPPSIHSSSRPFSFDLSGPVRQISIGTQQDESYVGVRSDYLCGVWKVGETIQPSTLEVIQTNELATCLSASPHIPGELLVTSESGAVHLWTLGKGLQKFRKEDSNLYFNARSAWRWCDFSGHPRVMVYADRTGVELTDIRARENCNYTLFRIGATPDCKSGERVILSKYLRDVHTFHHLVTTQYSAYILDERSPCIPMVKWDHMMEHPPMFAQVLAGSTPGGGTTKVVLGSQRCQQLTLLQYSGGREQACCSRGPPRALLRPKDAMRLLPDTLRLLPHRQHKAKERLAQHVAGLTCVQQSKGEECICVLQLTEAGDIFYQMLRPEKAPSEEEEEAEEAAPSEEEEEAEEAAAPEEEEAEEAAAPGEEEEEAEASAAQNSEDTSEPTPAGHRPSAGTPRRRPSKGTSENRNGGGGVGLSESPGSPEDSESEGRDASNPEFEVVVNDGPDDSQPGLSDSAAARPQSGDGGGGGGSSSRETGVAPPPVRPNPADAVSEEALLAWKTWILKAVRQNRCQERLRHLPYKEIETNDNRSLKRLYDPSRKEEEEEDRRRCLSRELVATARNGGVLVHGATGLPPLEMHPVPDAVAASAWPDDLSQRLSASWEGGWSAWWAEKLGTNREEKLRALRRKRRRQKLARAGGGRAELSGSFASSTDGGQSDQDLSGWSSGWSSATSQGDASSDAESWGTALSSAFTNDDFFSDPGTPGGSLGSGASQKQRPWRSGVSAARGDDWAETDVLSAAPQKTPKDYFSSLFGSQETSRGGFDDEGSCSGPLATSSQLSSSQRSARAGPSSQPKKKKSRIGF